MATPHGRSLYLFKGAALLPQDPPDEGKGFPGADQAGVPPFPWFFMENQTKGMGGEPRVELLLEELENQRFFNAFNGKSTNEREGGRTGGFPPFPPFPQRKVVKRTE